MHIFLGTLVSASFGQRYQNVQQTDRCSTKRNDYEMSKRTARLKRYAHQISINNHFEQEFFQACLGYGWRLSDLDCKSFYILLGPMGHVSKYACIKIGQNTYLASSPWEAWLLAEYFSWCKHRDILGSETWKIRIRLAVLNLGGNTLKYAFVRQRHCL
jgi:hypothetical protein